MDKDNMADDKFILMGLGDERSAKVAEVLKSLTCKKILNYLSEIREASEKDIADALKIPINTVEYNLKKLIKSGLVDKAKNFFWSVKGKKIPMYKLARKHIIISPSKKPSLSYLKNILPVVLIAVIVIILAGVYLFPEDESTILNETKLKQFSSQAELNEFIKENVKSRGFFEGFGGIAKGMAETTTAAATPTAADSALDYSTTNIQVEGVDEADIVKNDGKYIYAVSNNKIIIVDAYPAEDMKVLSEMRFDNYVNEIFVNDDKLIIFFYQEAYIYDISDKKEPELETKIGFDGDYIDSRMINKYVYIISNKYVHTNNPQPPIYELDGVKQQVSVTDVYYWDYPDTSYVFTSIIAINLDNNKFNSKVYLTGGSRNIYVSQDNIYLTYTKNIDYTDYAEEIAEEVYFPLLSNEYDDKIKEVLDSDVKNWEKLNEMQKIVEEYSKTLEGEDFAEFSEKLSKKLEKFEIDIQKKIEKTVIHKINIDEMNINYVANGEVLGHILNQFSMDEYEGYFRIATTTGHASRSGSSSLNHLYILDKDLKIVGSVEDLAEGEKIYSVRFLGNRVYIVTFKKVDPLFVIDVSNPENPEVLGYLKITGYSDYLHIYDENHVIGIGKETKGGNEHFSWYQGVKVSLFDVSDVSNPIEKAKIEIGDRGTDSLALREHKAVLFDKDKNLLVIPISLAEINKSKYEDESKIPDNAYGKQVWQGVFVLDISLDGIKERGRISHDNETPKKNKYRYGRFDYNKQIKRSLYMDDVLYTISNSIVKANDLETIEEINFVDWGYDSYPVYE